MALTYDTICTETQSTIRSLLVGNATILGFTSKVLDGIPTDLLQGKGFPYVIVGVPTHAENYSTFRLTKADILVAITIYTMKEGNLRQMMDAVRKALRDGDATVKAAGLYQRHIQSTDSSPSLTGENKAIYVGTIVVSYEWRET